MSERRSLAQLQAWMVDAICGPAEAETGGIVVEGPRLSGAARLGIYRYAYRARLRECLGDDYPVLAATLGAARFAALGDAYVARYPSRSPSLNAFGKDLAHLCAASPSLESSAFHAELAALEWALVEVTHAQTPAPLDLEALQRMPAEAWARARLVASEAVRLLRFDYPVNQFYQAYRERGVVPPLPAAEATITLVYRREISLWRRDLTPAMAGVLGALLAGEPIADALAQLDAAQADEVTQWFRDWVAGGLFTGVCWD